MAVAEKDRGLAAAYSRRTSAFRGARSDRRAAPPIPPTPPMPSAAEALGLVLVEAMACGLPLIACPAHGPAAIVADGRTGWARSAQQRGPLVDALVGAANGQEELRACGRRAQ
jgi:glycosyltransferase involved in cell wall biosynthesis